MNTRTIINYIKIREAWREALRAKSNAVSSIWSGLFGFGSFLAYWAVENFFLAEEIAELYKRNPNYKYIFYLTLAFGLWGLINSAIGVYNYFQASSEAGRLQVKVAELERKLETNF
ncbi:MAG: hypothetical protein I3273_01770 [Candidatus Moeniiplasma glomeromycotorum]|nr:hypothetical protein [Candidatus Moeniiplasma glomeromycotorum]MCE8167151.1 hypothetical protein [Candidatus Moeniiplasma glomeromycotorum]MCE8168837.1 hypothetical protein [Candidatus Moeniiplasma glomeromycotorum]